MKIKYPQKRTKIICTIGPSSWDKQVLTKMIENGMNVARVNGAFADVAELERVAKLVRSISPEVALMLDIKGHEVRLNKFENVFNVKKGDTVVLGHNKTDPINPVTYLNLYKDISKGQVIFIDKGEVTMEVMEIKNNDIYCKVISGNTIKPGKGMNFPGAKLKNEPITSRDIEQIKFACKDNWDFIAGSFIRNKDDVKIIKKYISTPYIKFISKIEDQQGVDNLEEILFESDGIMIARGDMGSEIPIEKLPIIQKMMILSCNMAAKPVITATNMLESMIEKPFPTRAEVTDIANAVLDGTDAIMTSGETSGGKYPVESIDMMSRIAVENEKYLTPKILEDAYFENRKVAVSISNAAFEVVQGLNIDVVVTFSPKDTLPRLISRLNLPCRIISLVNDKMLRRQLSMSKGIESYEFDACFTDRDDVIQGIKKYLATLGTIKKGNKILIIGKYKDCKSKEPKYTNIFEFIEN